MLGVNGLGKGLFIKTRQNGESRLVRNWVTGGSGRFLVSICGMGKSVFWRQQVELMASHADREELTARPDCRERHGSSRSYVDKELV